MTRRPVCLDTFSCASGTAYIGAWALNAVQP